ncbi:MAG: DnaD domain protein [Subdoligranulum sp.]|nr:DnaD domain protein [Subdoligranulum sp.]
MAYRLAENKGDSVAVPRLVFAKLPELEEDWLRVALYVIDTGETDPARIAAALRLKGAEQARTALVYWKGTGLLHSDETPAARGDLEAAPRARLTTAEVNAAAQTDASIAGLVQECQRLMGGVVTQADTNIFVSMYLSDGMPVDMILLGVAHFAALGKRSARYIERALLGWQRDGIDSGEAAERYLQLLETRAAHERETAELFGLKDAKFTKAEGRAIADWYESFGYDAAMIAEAIAYADEKKNVKYVNGILRAWYTKGYKTVRDVMAGSAQQAENVRAAEPAARHNILGGGLRRAPRIPNMPDGQTPDQYTPAKEGEKP